MVDVPSPKPEDQLQPPAPAPERNLWRDSLRILIPGGAGLAFALFTLALGIALFGSASDGSPAVWLRLMPGAAQIAHGPDAPPEATSFHPVRMVQSRLVADPALVEDSFEGPLPKIAADGRNAMTAYAMPIDPKDTRPKIAIVIGGLGISAATTASALAQLPPAVTVAFAPFAANLQAGIDKARGQGHEVLIQVPMEPFDFPNSDPGPHALLVAAPAEENVKRFDWALSRATGYVGTTNLLGARFLSEANAIEPILAESARRGILFFDSGVSTRSLAATAARHVHAALATGTLILDEMQERAAIDTRLVQLEKQAKADGFAIGVGALYPVTVERIAGFANEAESRGLHLVPISALAAPPDTSARASAR